jgi:tetratricopeptide (TPR) repeat protein
MSTVALSMIVKDEYDKVFKIVTDADGYFDQINIVVSDKTTANKLGKLKPVANYNVQYREWTNRFDEARNASREMCTTDYFFWLDADDSFDFRAIPQLVALADKNHIDAIFLPYNYAQDEEGNCVTRHWRERLVRLNKGFSWRGWVHETCISDQPYTSHKVDFEVKHNTSPDHAKESILRNHQILEKAYAETKDPRYAHYLGMSYFAAGEYETCIDYLSEHLRLSGSVEDTYRSLSVISECAYHLGQYPEALEYATRCATLKPEYPMAYWLLAQYEADKENWKEALEWLHVSETKPNPETLSVFDPSSRQRAALMGAQAEFMLGNYNAAYQWIKKAGNNPAAQDLLESFRSEAEAETFTTLIPKIRKFFKNDIALWKSLVPDLQFDTRTRDLRYSATEPKKWNDKSIVIFCGQGYEEWGPHTMDKGMGGSEEAVIYLSREMAMLGYNVTVYGETTLWDNLADNGSWYYTDQELAIDNVPRVVYRPWKEIDTRDEFNVFISWRQPQFLERVNAKVKLADIHDVLPENIIKDYPDVTYLFKSAYQKGLYPNLPQDKSVVIGNGIKKEQFREDS